MAGGVFWKAFAPVAQPAVSAFPGQPGNLVGFANTPSVTPAKFTLAGGVTWPGAYPGSLTAWPGGGTLSDGTNATSGAGTVGNPWVFAFYDFQGSAGDVNGAGGSLWIINISNVIFVGCRFGVNHVDQTAVIVGLSATPTNVNYIYCTVAPRTAFYTSPPGFVWPSAGQGQSTNTYSDDVNCIKHVKSYQGGISLPASGSNYIIDHLDMWGFGNAIIVNDGTSNVTISDCHIHDAANSVDPRGTNDYHTDGPGYLNGNTGPSHITVDHCTIASIGTTNGIAWQQLTGANIYDHMTVNNCYMSGFANLIDMCHDITTNTNLTFTNNIISTDIQWFFGSGGTSTTNTMFRQATNLWQGNKFKFVATTNGTGYTLANDGKFLWPDGTVNSVEFS